MTLLDESRTQLGKPSGTLSMQTHPQPLRKDEEKAWGGSDSVPEVAPFVGRVEAMVDLL